MFCETIEIIFWSLYESSRKHENSAEKYHDQTMKFTHSAVELIPFYPWVCSHHTFAVCNLILRCLTGSHITILWKSNHRVKLNLNMDTQWLNLILFQCWERLPLCSKTKTTLLRQSAILLNEQNKSCDSWLKRERGRNVRSPFAIIWKLSR